MEKRFLIPLVFSIISTSIVVASNWSWLTIPITKPDRIGLLVLGLGFANFVVSLWAYDNIVALLNRGAFEPKIAFAVSVVGAFISIPLIAMYLHQHLPGFQPATFVVEAIIVGMFFSSLWEMPARNIYGEPK